VADFVFEKKFWKKGFKVVAGTDEVGRGAWAGPVVAAVVVWPPLKFSIFNFPARGEARLRRQFEISKGIKIDDSKKLNPQQRENADRWIKENALVWGIGEAPVSVINRLGIGKATRMAFRRAVAGCNKRLQTTAKNMTVDGRSLTVDFLLIDAFYLPFTKGIKRKNQLAIIHGDEKSFSIAAASIIAKVYRDNLMCKLAQKYKKYGWDKNKGYGTLKHQEAIKKHGLTHLHRKDFVQKELK